MEFYKEKLDQALTELKDTEDYRRFQECKEHQIVDEDTLIGNLCKIQSAILQLKLAEEKGIKGYRLLRSENKCLSNQKPSTCTKSMTKASPTKNMLNLAESQAKNSSSMPSETLVGITRAIVSPCATYTSTLIPVAGRMPLYVPWELGKLPVVTWEPKPIAYYVNYNHL